MRRWTLLLAGAALWLFLAAIPALADGGPHVAANNSGQSTLTADSCAGCHRAHTAQAAYLLAVDEEDLCLSCHGINGTGATTNVEDGVQYASAATSTTAAGPVAGALRSGGFVNARIAASGPITRVPYPRDEDRDTAGTQVTASFSGYVPVAAAGAPVTSAHFHVEGGYMGTGIAWGNGAANSGAGPVVALECTSCHNVHGNNQFRILNPIPSPDGADFVEATTAAAVAEVRDNPAGTGAAGTRNYTVKWGATLADVNEDAYPNAASPDGDYWRLYQPYDVVPTWSRVEADVIVTPANAYSGDIPEFVPGQALTSSTWRGTMSNWCSTCHSRYHTANNAWGFAPPPTGQGSYNTDSGDDIYTYRHGTVNRQCTACHVAHGSNAAMDGEGATAYSADYPYPDGTTSASSRLLKVANRGTCQLCHDPTGTIEWDSAPITH